jgi:hypothetical protein
MPAVVSRVGAARLATVTPHGVVVRETARSAAFVSAEVRPIVPGGVKAVRNPLASTARGHRRRRGGARQEESLCTKQADGHSQQFAHCPNIRQRNPLRYQYSIPEFRQQNGVVKVDDGRVSAAREGRRAGMPE